MRVGVIPETVLERIGLLANLAPVPMAEGLFGFLLARTVMIGTRLGVFEALAAGPLDAAAVAERCHTDAAATERLLHALAGCRYLTPGRGGQYALSRSARKWLLADAPGSCRDRLLMQFLEWDWCQHTEEYVRSGRPLPAFAALSDEGWGIYQRGMRAGIAPLAWELARRIKLPRKPERMLDLGGGHGRYSVALCRRHPSLSSTILELPEAIGHAAPLLADEGMGERVAHRAGDVLRDDLGSGEYDLVLVASLAHHFDGAQNQALMTRIARALKPGGVVAVFEALRREPTETPTQVSGLMDLFLATISPAGTRHASEIAGWQRGAGLLPRRPLRLRLAPDLGAQCAVKPAVESA